MKHYNSLLLLLLFSINSCKFVKPIVYNLPDEKDARRFPYRTVNAADKSSIFNFIKTVDTLPVIKNIKVENKSMNSTGISLNQFVKLHKTISFAIIRNDSILYEYYAKNYGDKIMSVVFLFRKHTLLYLQELL